MENYVLIVLIGLSVCNAQNPAPAVPSTLQPGFGATDPSMHNPTPAGTQCSSVVCMPVDPVCPDGSTPFIPTGSCCAECPYSVTPIAHNPTPPGSQCSSVVCPPVDPYCADGSAPYVPAGGCCSECPFNVTPMVPSGMLHGKK